VAKPERWYLTDFDRFACYVVAFYRLWKERKK
jgi:hypothetical protein